MPVQSPLMHSITKESFYSHLSEKISSGIHSSVYFDSTAPPPSVH